MKNKGFTLVESVVVIAVLSILALLGTETIIEFQKNAVLEATANEMASTLRSARTKSLAGELFDGHAPDYFSILPYYGVETNNDSYFIFREYHIAGDPDPDLTVNNLDDFTFIIDDRLTLTPVGARVIFDRVSGYNSPITFTLERNDGRGKKEIEINEQGIKIRPI